MTSKVSIIKLAEEYVQKYIFNSNEKFHKWGNDNLFPEKILKLYDSVPEHESSINFLENNIVGDGLIQSDIIDFWSIKKISLDFVLFGGYTIKATKLRNGNIKYEYIDIAKCRYNPNKDKIGYSEDWSKYKVDIEWYPLVTSADQIKSEAIYYFKNNKSRELYPRPSYLSAFKSIETADAIAEYHNQNAKHGFTPSTVIQFNGVSVDDDEKRQINKEIQDNFTGPSASRFLTFYNQGSEQNVKIEKLEADNLDQKFESLQKFVQNQILISHHITSGQLIGVKAENQGFSKTEFNEALDVFNETVVKPFRNEIEYSLSILTGEDIKFIEKNTDNNNTDNTTTDASTTNINE